MFGILSKLQIDVSSVFSSLNILLSPYLRLILMFLISVNGIMDL